MGIDALGANLTTMVTGRPEAGEENALDGNSCNPIGFTGIHQESRKPEALKSLTQIRAGSRFVLAFALFGGMDLDLRDAVFEAPVVEIAGFWCFGGLDMKVPEGIDVRDQTAGIFGGTDVRDIGNPVPGAPTLVIKGVALFGGVSVRGRKATKKPK